MYRKNCKKKNKKKRKDFPQLADMQTSASRVNQINVRRTTLTVAQAVNQLKDNQVGQLKA